MNVNAYLAFKGNCQEAMNFYSKYLGGEIINTQSYKDSSMDIPENYRNKLEHAELKGKGFHIMGYDASPDTPLTNGNNVHLSIDLNDEEKAEALFNKFSESGVVNHPFQKKDWGALYGRCTDQFGIRWMINCKL